MNNYDHEVLGTGNPDHPYNQVEMENDQTEFEAAMTLVLEGAGQEVHDTIDYEVQDLQRKLKDADAARRFMFEFISKHGLATEYHAAFAVQSKNNFKDVLREITEPKKQS